MTEKEDTRSLLSSQQIQLLFVLTLGVMMFHSYYWYPFWTKLADTTYAMLSTNTLLVHKDPALKFFVLIWISISMYWINLTRSSVPPRPVCLNPGYTRDQKYQIFLPWTTEIIQVYVAVLNGFTQDVTLVSLSCQCANQRVTLQVTNLFMLEYYLIVLIFSTDNYSWWNVSVILKLYYYLFIYVLRTCHGLAVICGPPLWVALT